ncbi:hypothetical protein IMZ48_26980, partial [Candidatus Bathyarchaeota archaeon]|nr:hypothetical protein [Candidatus Bathyarchaeota archaeon]
MLSEFDVCFRKSSQVTPQILLRKIARVEGIQPRASHRSAGDQPIPLQAAERLENQRGRHGEQATELSSVTRAQKAQRHEYPCPRRTP